MEQWAEEEVERELTEMTGSLEQLAGLEEKEGGGVEVCEGWNCVVQYWKWDSRVACDVSSCTNQAVCQNRPLLRS